MYTGHKHTEQGNNSTVRQQGIRQVVVRLHTWPTNADTAIGVCVSVSECFVEGKRLYVLQVIMMHCLLRLLLRQLTCVRMWV